VLRVAPGRRHAGGAWGRRQLQEVRATLTAWTGTRSPYADPQLAADVAAAHADAEEMDRVYAMNLAMIRKAA
jgi:hypothetical protein